MSRELTEHEVNSANDTLKVDETGQNCLINVRGNENAITREVLLDVLADLTTLVRNVDKANACALTHIGEVQHWLRQSTLERR